MNCLAHIVKYILWIFNITFLLCGIALITIGSIMLSSLNDYTKFDDVYDPKTLPILLIILGSVVFIVSFFGCCGAMRENTCCITTYAIFMFIIFCLQVSLVVWMFVERNTFLNTMTDIINQSWAHNEETNGNSMGVIEVSFNCCGFTGYDDYQKVPSSCCGQLIAPSSFTCSPNVYQSKPGCYQKYYDFWSTNVDVIRFVGIAIALIELLALTFACCLASSIKKSRGY